MEREPVAQMSNGQPFVPPSIDGLSVNAMEGGVISPITAQVATMWKTITSVEIATVIYTSLLISTSITIQTSYINVAVPSQLSGISNIGLYPPPSSSSVSPVDINNMSTAITFPTLSESTFLSSSTTASLPFPPTSMNSTSMLTTPTSLPSSPLTSAVSRHESITKLMIGLVAGIFVAAGLLTSFLIYSRKRSNRISEVEAANAQRQQQPLISEPVPYSSAYGSNGQN